MAALSESALRLLSAKIGDSIAMLDLLDMRFASNIPATRSSDYTSIYSKTFRPNDEMPKFVDELEAL